MAERPGFLGGLRRTDSTEIRPAFVSDRATLADLSFAHDAGPGSHRAGDGRVAPADFDPVWGTLGPATSPYDEIWPARKAPVEGVFVDVELLGAGFHFGGQIHTGRFDRLSGWINIQSGFVQVRDAVPINLDNPGSFDPSPRRRTLWVRLSQIVVVADLSAIQQTRPGAPIVQKRRRQVSIVSRSYELAGDIHVHADGDMAQFLEAADPRFLAITDVTVRRITDRGFVARFPFAMVNREQLVTIVDESKEPAVGTTPLDASDG